MDDPIKEMLAKALGGAAAFASMGVAHDDREVINAFQDAVAKGRGVILKLAGNDLARAHKLAVEDAIALVPLHMLFRLAEVVAKMHFADADELSERRTTR